jgi:hypothetical protein
MDEKFFKKYLKYKKKYRNLILGGSVNPERVKEAQEKKSKWFYSKRLRRSWI